MEHEHRRESEHRAGTGPLPRRPGRLASLEHMVSQHLESAHVPAWLRPTAGEHRYQVTAAVLAAIVLQVATPPDISISPSWLLPAMEGAVLVGLVAANPGRIDRRSARLRGAMLVLVAAISFANVWSLILLTHEMVVGNRDLTAPHLLLAGVAVWATNVIVFSLWYWEFDRGGPAARSQAVHRYPDLLFPQMAMPSLAAEDWEPAYFDYLYTSFTNATAFSPTDTMPLSRWTKVLFLVQSSVSLLSAALVVAGAVNLLK